jgi:hypothetical protein
MKKILVLAALLMAGAWSTLYLTSTGVLVRQTNDSLGEEIIDTLQTCTYFNGTSLSGRWTIETVPTACRRVTTVDDGWMRLKQLFGS